MSDVNWDLLPGRQALSSTLEEKSAAMNGKRVLITGAGGCIGSALAQALCLGSPEQLILLDKSEQGIYELEQQFRLVQNAERIVTLLGDVCDDSFLEDSFQRYRPQIVFHAAAFKHVPLLEYNPFAAIRNNTLGTARLVQRAIAHHCEQFILVSTDKAADPKSIMGASKRLAEMILLSVSGPTTDMKAVRLGNVLDSPGSIVPVFRDQIHAGKPLTITHPDVRRYFMTIDEAVEALLDASLESYGSGLFVPHLSPPVRILELAQFMFRALRPLSLSEPELLLIPLRPGDKTEEVLISKDEAWAVAMPQGPSIDRLRRVKQKPVSSQIIQAALDTLQETVNMYTLDSMLNAVISMIPNYQPSAVISEQVKHSRAAMAGRIQ